MILIENKTNQNNIMLKIGFIHREKGKRFPIETDVAVSMPLIIYK